MGSKVTLNLKIPIVESLDLVSKDSINNVSKAIDQHALPIEHKESKMHWDMWKSETKYKKQDVFRTTTIPSWGYWEVTVAGTSGDSEPLGSGEGDTVTDGNCELILRRLTSDSNGITKITRNGDKLTLIFADKTTTDVSINDISHALNADKAINDVNGKPITGYISSVTSSENKLTFTKGDGTKTEVSVASKADCNVNPWSADTSQYVANKSLVTINNALYLCIKTHKPSNDFTADLKAGNWKEVGNSSGQTTTAAEPWNSSTTQYVANKSLVTYDQSLYLCLVTHKPSSSFEADLAKDYWKKVDSDQTVIGSNSGYSQITKKSVTAPKTVSIAINNTPSLCLPPVEILKAGTQETNVSVKINDFSASDEAQFTHTDSVEFGDSGLKLKNDYSVAMSIPVALGSAGYISQSDEIDFSVYKSVEGVDV